MAEGKRAPAEEERHAADAIGASAMQGHDSTHKRKKGEKASFVDLMRLPERSYRTLMGRLIRIAERVGVPRDQCEDLAQEAWVRALRRRESFRGVDKLPAWLAAVVHNLAVDALRHRNALPLASLEDLTVELLDEQEMHHENKSEIHERLTAWLARLEREQPEICWLVRQRYLEGRKVRELVEETGMKPHEISYRIHRAIRKMRSWASESSADD